MILFYMRALLLLCRPPCLNKHGVTHTTRRVTTRKTCRSCRVMTQQV